MPRAYISSAARCRQLERLVMQRPGATIPELVQAIGTLSYPSVCTYMHRLQRERRVSVVLEDASMCGNARQRFYPPGGVPPARKVA